MSVVPSRMRRLTSDRSPGESTSLRAPFALRMPQQAPARRPTDADAKREVARRAAPAPSVAHYAPATRLRLWELPTHFLCSIVGTCLSTGELRRILTKALVRDLAADTDVELHTEAVSLAATGGPGGRAIHKALDQRHAGVVKRLGREATLVDLGAAWDDALANGDIPGTYWAVMSHRASDDALLRRAFGDIHMLSHLVGSANRADLRRLRALEDERAALRVKLERQQSHLQEAFRARDAAWASLSALVVERTTRDTPVAAEQGELATLRELVQRQARHIARLEERGAQADARIAAQLDRVAALKRSLDERDGQCDTLAAELAGLESLLRERGSADGACASLRGVAVLYVGGLAQSVPAIRQVVQERGGLFLHHDGGLEERTGALDGLVSRCDVALFPVDCISHEAALGIKRLCRRFGRPFVPLRSAGLSSAVAAIDRQGDPATSSRRVARDATPSPAMQGTA